MSSLKPTITTTTTRRTMMAFWWCLSFAPTITLGAAEVIEDLTRLTNGNEGGPLKIGLGIAATLLVIGISTALLSNFKKDGSNGKESRISDLSVNPDDLVKKVSTNGGGGVVIKGMDQVKKRTSGADVIFDGIHLTLTTDQKKKKGNKEGGNRTLLDGSFHGRVRPGRMLAIMGPSGAGKSVFLHALAGRIKADSKLKLKGERFLDGELLPPDAILPAAFVEQEVNFFPRMTVRETLVFRVALHYGDELDVQGRDKLVNSLLRDLGLTVCADTIVGDSKVRGISSGERKRLSIAVEMISSPRLVCCDEPTSSLDSVSASVVIEQLRNMARHGGKTVVCVIHQPSSMIFHQFDDVLLISEGKQMYFGSTRQVRRYMQYQGYMADEGTGTAEHILECVSPIPCLWESPKDAKERLQIMEEGAQEQRDAMNLGLAELRQRDSCPSLCAASVDTQTGEGVAGRRPRTSMWTQFKLLLQRAVAENFRGKDVILIKTMQQVVVAAIYGCIYSLGNNQASIKDRLGLLSLTAIGGTNMAIATTLRSFPKEKTIASAEIAINQYRALPYFAAKAISEFPLVFFYNAVMGTVLYFSTGMNPGRFWYFLGLLTLHSLASEASGMAVGAVSPSSDFALAVFPAILILSVVFDGRNISIENTPFLLQWIPKVSLIRWGYEGFVANEFEGLEFDVSDAKGPVGATNGEEALLVFGMEGANIQDVVTAELLIMVVCWVLAYFGLSLTKQKFVTMDVEEPKKDEEKEKEEDKEEEKKED